MDSFKHPENLPEPAPIDIVAAARGQDSLALYFQVDDEVRGYRLDAATGLSLAYTLFGLALSLVHDIGHSEREKSAEGLLEGIDLDVEKPWSKRSDNETEEPPSDLWFF